MNKKKLIFLMIVLFILINLSIIKLTKADDDKTIEYSNGYKLTINNEIYELLKNDLNKIENPKEINVKLDIPLIDGGNTYSLRYNTHDNSDKEYEYLLGFNSAGGKMIEIGQVIKISTSYTAGSSYIKREKEESYKTEYYEDGDINKKWDYTNDVYTEYYHDDFIKKVEKISTGEDITESIKQEFGSSITSEGKFTAEGYAGAGAGITAEIQKDIDSIVTGSGDSGLSEENTDKIKAIVKENVDLVVTGSGGSGILEDKKITGGEGRLKEIINEESYNYIINELGVNEKDITIIEDEHGKVIAFTVDGKDGKYTVNMGINENGGVDWKLYTRDLGDGKVKVTIYDSEHKEPIMDGVYDSNKGKEEINLDDLWSDKLGIKLKDVYEEDGVLYATLEDGSKGILLEDKNQFVYGDSGDEITHTLQAIEGGSLLEYYKDESEDYGTIKISIDKKVGDEIEKETIIFDGIYDENKKIIKKGDKLIAEIDENGRILTDFNEEGIPQTIHYPANNEFCGTYAFGKVQNDKSEKIFLSGYEPIAFKTESGDLIIITTDDDGNRIYTDIKRNILNENSAGVKEAKAMVIKSKIGPAFYAAVEGARGGIALSNLLNSWLDIDFINKWRKKSDEFFSQTVIGRIISGKWEESVCHSKIEKIPNSVAVVNINGEMGFAAHVEGERSAAITTSNETLYFYKITFGVNPYGMGNITFELLIDGNKADLDGDGTADKIKLEADETYSGTGENAVVRYKDKIYEEVCIKFYNTENLNTEFRNSLKNDKLCNKINEVDLSSVEISKAGSTAVSSTSTGQQGW